MHHIPYRLIVLLIFIWAVWILRLSEPYYGIRDGLEIWIAAAVRNLNTYGANNVGYLVTTDILPVANPAELTAYTHHPPLVAWLPALFTRLVGFHELGVRYVFVAASMISASAYYVLVRRLFDTRFAFWALALFALTPMIAYFLTSHNHDPLGFMAVMLFSAILVQWYRSPSRLRLLALCCLAVLAVWTAWPAVFFVAVLSLFIFVLGNHQHRMGVVFIGMSGLFAVIALIAFYELQAPGAIDRFIEAYLWRSSNTSGQRGSEAFTVVEWFTKNFIHVIFFSTIGLVSLAGFGIRSLYRQASSFAKLFTLALFISAITYLLAFRNASFIHDYYKTWLNPSLAITATAAIVWMRPRLKRSWRAVIDGMIIVMVIQTLYIFFVFLIQFQNTEMGYMLEVIEQEDTTTTIYIDSEIDENNEKIIEFYAQRDIFFDNFPAEIPENTIVIDCLTEIEGNDTPCLLLEHQP